ncbi:hypothetical protein [Aliiglaciecola sp. LCG003]|uniref:hypothetical protein n=1 Tax=Aliiglaciecola sp. LCG003 TaxID=3053655 RepID=UPI0025737A84|nr:hypothetical protein [Aliiglaciecola sp. LCG003]WJG08897.1 hypothetical protein QR722_16395 [Aliiglaciecola sp. LCG003]
MHLNIILATVVLAFVNFTALANSSSISAQAQFFNSLHALCGKAFAGQVTVDNAPGDGFNNKKLIMHVRQCSDDTLHIPFHVGSNASRTWVISKTVAGLSLKHDHRHEDGSEDKLSQYGGHTLDDGWPQVQSFPADQYSKQLFVDAGIPQSIGNTWQMYIYPDKFTYRLIRQGREFRVDFDLTNPVATPHAAWGYKD